MEDGGGFCFDKATLVAPTFSCRIRIDGSMLNWQFFHKVDSDVESYESSIFPTIVINKIAGAGRGKVRA